MSFAHITLPTPHVEVTANFLELVFGYHRKPTPANSPVPLIWLDIGNGQELHILHVDGATSSPFEGEFGRHIALFHPLGDFPALQQRVLDNGGTMMEPLRETPFRRLFFREPTNGYIFEVIDATRAAR